MTQFAALSQKNINEFIEKVTPVKFFVVMAALFGVMFLLITPPFQTPDEPAHFFRAYQISTFNFIPDEIPSSKLGGGVLPKSLGETLTLTQTQPAIQFNPNLKYNLHKTKRAFSIHTEPGQNQIYETSSAIFTPFMYAPQVGAILVGRALGAPPILMLYMARFAVLMTWIVLFALVIHLIPRKKWAAVAVGLLPMTMFVTISLSGDVLTAGLGSLFFVLILRLREQKSIITKKQLGLLVLIASLLVLVKGIMLIFLPLIFLIPNKVYGTKKLLYASRVSLVLMPLLLFGLWLFLIRDVNTQAIAAKATDPDTAKQFHFIAQNPFSYIGVLWTTYFTTWGDGITRSLIGIFGWVDTPLSEETVVIGYIGLAFLFWANCEDKVTTWLKRWEKWLIALVLIVFWLVVNTAIYTSTTPVGQKFIAGVQGRYFLPALVPAIAIFYSGWLRTSLRAYKRVAVGLPIFLLVVSIVTLWLRYYVHIPL